MDIGDRRQAHFEALLRLVQLTLDRGLFGVDCGQVGGRGCSALK